MATFSFDLTEGLNAVSIPLQLSGDAAKWTNILSGVAFNSIRTVVDGQWMDYIRGRSSTLNDFDSAELAAGYLIDVVRLSVSPTVLGLSPGTYQAASLTAGSSVYQDATSEDTILAIPSEHEGAVWIQTTRALQADASAALVTYTVDRNINLYVAYNNEPVNPLDSFEPPTWLTDWEDTGKNIETTGHYYRIFRAPQLAGVITLPGNSYQVVVPTEVPYLIFMEEDAYPVAVTTPSNSRRVKLADSRNCYLDITMSALTIPSYLEKVDWIILNNSEVSNATSNYLTFTLPYDANVYVAYSDTSTEGIPQWLSDFLRTTDTVSTSSGTSVLYKKFFAAGEVILGGASAPTLPDPSTPFLPGPNANALYNYFVALEYVGQPSVTITVEGASPSNITEVPIAGTAKGGLSFIGFPKSELANHSIQSNLDARGLKYAQLYRLTKGIWESYIPGRDALLNWYPADLELGKGYLLISSIEEDQILEIQYDV